VITPSSSLSFLTLAVAGSLFLGQAPTPAIAAAPGRELTLTWDKEILTIRGDHLPGGALDILYIEAFCRPGSTARAWSKTVIPHRTNLVASDANGRSIKLRSRLEDGVVVDHEIRAGRDEVDFQLVATNPTTPGALPGRDRLHPFRLSHRRPRAGPDQGHPGQDLPDARRLPGPTRQVPQGFPRPGKRVAGRRL
jgi:hypothetical protein